jgi:hypothetical protein
LPRYYWGYVPFFGWSYGEQFKRFILVAKCCTEARGNCAENDPSLDTVEMQLAKPWNSDAVFYNAACYYAILASKVSQKKAYERKAIRLLKKAIRDPRTSFDHEWIKIDPDLKPLHANLEFKAIFDIPDEKEIQSQETKEIKARYYALVLMLQSAQQQQTHIQKWGKKKISPQELLAGADHQARIWRSLLNLAEKPADRTLQTLFWHVAMQTTDQPQPLPGMDQAPPPEKATLKVLDECWQGVKNAHQHLPAIWEAHVQDGKLFLEHGEAKMSDVWSLWAQAEKRQWEYLAQHALLYLKKLAAGK